MPDPAPASARDLTPWRIAFAAYFVALAGIITGAYLGGLPDIIRNVPYADAFIHFFAVGGAGYLAHRALGRRRFVLRGANLPLGPVVIAGLAVAEECLQALAPTRTFSLLDMGANVSGVLFLYWLDGALLRREQVDLGSVIARLFRFGKTLAVSAVFPCVIFGTLAATRHMSFGPFARYDVIFVSFVLLQLALILAKFEDWHDARIAVSFHIVGLGLELYKVNVGAWAYPEDAWTKIHNVPLYSGFMYGSVAAFLSQLWKRLQFSLTHWPGPFAVALMGMGIYLHYFASGYSAGMRSLLMLGTGWLFARSRLEYVNSGKRRSIPVLFVFSALGLFVWIAENLATYLGAWAYPYQLEHWQMVKLSKINAWFLLGIVSFILVAEQVRLRTKGSKATADGEGEERTGGAPP
jgi:uncharacterized membrane protein YoaT (DUF817 family)